MVQLPRYDDIEKLLADQPRQVALIVAVRSALRVAPLLGRFPHRQPARRVDVSRVLPALRAIAVTWAAVLSPRRVKIDYLSAARGASNDHEDYASFAAVFAANSAQATSRKAAVDFASMAVGNAAMAARVWGNSSGEGAIYRAVVSEMALWRDDHHGERSRPRPSDLAMRPLWRRKPPLWCTTRWSGLRSALLRDDLDWQVWTDWYEKRFLGGPVDRNLEVARVMIDPNAWSIGPRVVNKEISRVIGESYQEAPLTKSRTHRRKSEPEQIRSVDPGTSFTVPQPIEKVPSAVGFGISASGQVIVTISPTNVPVFPRPRSKSDYADRLQACRVLAKDLVSRLNPSKPRYQARETYRQQLENYLARLPTGPDDGNILLADAAARILRSLFQAEAAELSPEFAAELKILLEQQIGLRAFYPGVEEFYSDVKTGRLEIPLPLDAVEGVLGGVIQFTPTVFDPSVTEEMASGEEPPPHLSQPTDTAPPDADQPQPPPDPIGEVDPTKSHNFRQAGTVNALWKAFLDGEKINKALEGWQKAGETLAPHVAKVLDWLHAFLPGGGPPTS